MLSTLKEAINVLSMHPTPSRTTGESVADALLGKYADILPQGKTSTEVIRELRSSCIDRKRDSGKSC